MLYGQSQLQLRKSFVLCHFMCCGTAYVPCLAFSELVYACQTCIHQVQWLHTSYSNCFCTFYPYFTLYMYFKLNTCLLRLNHASISFNTHTSIVFTCYYHDSTYLTHSTWLLVRLSPSSQHNYGCRWVNAAPSGSRLRYQQY